MEIREIKSSLNILTVLQHYNLSANKNSILKCPFHDRPQFKNLYQHKYFQLL